MGNPTILISVIFIIYFIREQFEFGRASRLELVAIPAFAAYQFFDKYKYTHNSVLLLIAIILISLAVSWYQAKNTRVRTIDTAVYWFKLPNDDEDHPIYKKEVVTRGGRPYLVGWALIVFAQLILEIFFVHEHLTSKQIGSQIIGEMLRDMAGAFRFSDAGSGSWMIWALTTFSSAGYTLWLLRKSPALRGVVFGGDATPNRKTVGIKEE